MIINGIFHLTCFATDTMSLDLLIGMQTIGLVYSDITVRNDYKLCTLSVHKQR